MTDLKIPNLNKNSDKYFFKKKLSLRRKSKRKLIKESLIMFFFSFLIFYLIYLLPNKFLIFNNFLINTNKLMENVLNSVTYFYEICLVIFIVLATIFAFILILGGFSRFIKIVRRKSRKISFK